MKFERLRKSHKKEIVIGAIVICIISSALTFATTKAKYKLTQSIDLVKGTINYKPYDFKIMAMYQENDSGTYTEINTMPSEGYIINEEKTYCTTDNKTKVKGKIKTVNGIHGLYNIAKSDKCYLYFDVKKITIPEIIATLNAKTSTPDFSQVAESDEGVYSVSDGMYGGYSYYWRGAVANNYVKFANFCWRIIRINGDGSIRLIYDGTTCHANGTITQESLAVASQAYNTNYNQSNYVGWTYEGTLQRPSNLTAATASNAKTQIDTWFRNNITGTNLSKVTAGKYCNDRNVASESTWSINGSVFYYKEYENINNYIPLLSCPIEDVYTLKVGLITASEVMIAGGKKGYNKNYYLYNGQSYWTMSPYMMNKSVAHVFFVDSYGSLYNFWAGQTNGLRPVINLVSDVTFKSGGAGTLDNPFVVS